MARAVSICSSVEGEKLDLKTRQFHASPPTKDPGTGKIRYGFRLGVRSSVVVTEAYAEPKASKAVDTSMTAIGDEILGTSIDGWSKKPLGKPNVSRGSASHSASFISIRGGCYAHIEIAPREILENAELNRAEQEASVSV